MKKIFIILLLVSFGANAQNKSIALKVSSVDTATMLTPYLRSTNFGLLKSGQTVSVDTSLIATRLRVQKGIDSLGAAKQAQLNGTGFVKASGTTISYDNSTYLTTSAASSTYLPLAGGNLTGIVNSTTRLNLGGATDNSAYLLNAKGSGAFNGAILADNSSTTGSGTFQIGINGVVKGTIGSVGLFQGNTDANIAFQSINGFSFFTAGATTNPAFQVKTDKTIQMDGALSGMSATFSSTITTGIPSGWSSAGAWKLGTKFTTTVALDTTGYITVDINGTLYYLALASPL